MRIFLFLYLFAFGATAQQNDCSLTLSGQISDEHNGEVLPFANIRLLGTTRGAVADSLGRYMLSSLCPGSFIVEVRHVSCEPLQKTIQLEASKTENFVLEHHDELLEEVAIHSTHLSETASQSNTELGSEELLGEQGKSLADALQQVTGVNTLSTGSSIKKPIIHGLHSNRILLMNNGVRHEGQQWGLEHAPEIDPFAADRITVVKGAASVRYGADAIAGVVLANPKPLYTATQLQGQVQLLGRSNGRQGAVSAKLEGPLSQLPGVHWRLQATGKRSGNLRAPDYYLANTASAEYNFNAAAGYSKARWSTELYYSQFNTQLGIFSGAHIGNLTDLQRAITAERPLVSSGFSVDHRFAEAAGTARYA